MTFKLVQHSTTRANAVYHVFDAGDGTVLGAITCPRGEEDNLLNCCRDSVPAAAATAGKQARAANAMVAALKREPRMSKAAILRGC
jgi:bifunctional ADP-heptose synthase (sugar kinase/adenylyltransferase)